MSGKYLGHGFDIHAGGMDLIFPHHENEIAQSEAADPEQGDFARAWMHNGFVNVDKEKMSKSLGNFVTVRDVLERNDPEAFRWFLLTVHYRGPIQFDTDKLEDGRVVFPGVDEAERRVDYVYSTLGRLSELSADAAGIPDKLAAGLHEPRVELGKAMQRAQDALDDDLNTSVALAELGEIARLGNDVCDLAIKRRKDAAFVTGARAVAAEALGLIDALARQLGLLAATREDYAQRTRERRLLLRGLSAGDIDAKIQARTAARQSKDFAKADELRQELEAQGVSLRDGASGTEWSVGV